MAAIRDTCLLLWAVENPVDRLEHGFLPVTPLVMHIVCLKAAHLVPI